MNGVEILNTIYIYDNLISPLWLILFLVAAFVISIIGICTLYYDTIQKILFTLIAVVGVGVVICFIGVTIETNEVVDTKYQVTISEETNFNEFVEKYEILNQEGKIYTVKERN